MPTLSFPGPVDLHAPSAAEERLAALAPAERDVLARRAQALASDRGLRFVRAEGLRDISLVLSPVALPGAQLDALGEAARRVVTALLKAFRAVREDEARARMLFSHLTPLERDALSERWREAEELLLARVDWFVDAAGGVHALEVNATIPAMPVYSDAAVQGFLEALAPDEVDGLFAQNGSNARWLVQAILRAAERAGRGQPHELDVSLVHRPNDSQITELANLAELLRKAGARARTATPDELVLDGDPHRIVYRHIFARYVEPASPLGKAFLDPARHGIWNRVDGWLEAKGLFAELSRLSIERPELFDESEREALRSCVPWTRLLDDVSDAELEERGLGIVLKRSHDYGGKSVVIGVEAGREGLRAALGAARRDSPGSWVAQALVDSPANDRWLCTPEGAKRVALHVDISTYASLIPGTPTGGSVVRGSPRNVVNIVGGGGVAPLLRQEVLAAALAAWK